MYSGLPRISANTIAMDRVRMIMTLKILKIHSIIPNKHNNMQGWES